MEKFQKPSNPPAYIPGIRLGVTQAGIRVPNREDLLVIEIAEGAQTAAVFTQNRFCAAPVILAKQHLSQCMPRALVINTGYANAGTGVTGMSHAQISCDHLAQLLDIAPESILPFSTGIIGEALPIDRLTAGLPHCLQSLNTEAWPLAAKAIMTTDTQPKYYSNTYNIDNKILSISGMAKGAGMICPNMATMLSFIATDAQIDSNLLQSLLNEAVEMSFNRITVDGDTSTNDAVTLTATGQGPLQFDNDSPHLPALREALRDVCTQLAQAIVKDAEGATKFITIHVHGGASESDCLTIAKTIAHSPLVKTALFAEDPNWGRMIAAIGRAPVAALDIQQVTLAINDIPVFANETLVPDYVESAVAERLQQTEITLSVSLGSGQSNACVWTSDLSHDYVSINADYRS